MADLVVTIEHTRRDGVDLWTVHTPHGHIVNFLSSESAKNVCRRRGWKFVFTEPYQVEEHDNG